MLHIDYIFRIFYSRYYSCEYPYTEPNQYRKIRARLLLREVHVRTLSGQMNSSNHTHRATQYPIIKRHEKKHTHRQWLYIRTSWLSLSIIYVNRIILIWICYHCVFSQHISVCRYSKIRIWFGYCKLFLNFVSWTFHGNRKQWVIINFLTFNTEKKICIKKNSDREDENLLEIGSDKLFGTGFV